MIDDQEQWTDCFTMTLLKDTITIVARGRVITDRGALCPTLPLPTIPAVTSLDIGNLLIHCWQASWGCLHT